MKGTPYATPNTGTMELTERNCKPNQVSSQPSIVSGQQNFLSEEGKDNNKDDNKCLSCTQCLGKSHSQTFSEEVEIMGLKPIFSADSHIVRRLLWAIIVLCGIGFAVFQIQSQISVYLSWPVTISVNISYVPELPFPRVIFCNYNSYKKSSFPQNLSGIDTSDISVLFEADIDNGLYNNTDWEEVYPEYAHQLNDTLLEVSG